MSVARLLMAPSRMSCLSRTKAREPEATCASSCCLVGSLADDEAVDNEDPDGLRLTADDSRGADADVEPGGDALLARQPDLFAADKACRDAFTSCMAFLARSAGVSVDCLAATGVCFADLLSDGVVGLSGPRAAVVGRRAASDVTLLLDLTSLDKLRLFASSSASSSWTSNFAGPFLLVAARRSLAGAAGGRLAILPVCKRARCARSVFVGRMPRTAPRRD